jgi:hypothetical protein
MPRLVPADKCPKCRGSLQRQPTGAGTIFACEKCDKDDPIKAADNWIKGGLALSATTCSSPSIPSTI